MADQTNDQKTNIPEGAKAVPPKGKTSGNKTLLIIGIVVVVLFVLPGIALTVFFGWLASGDNAENLTESVIEQSTGNDVNIDTNDGSFSIETDQGSIDVGGEQTLPEDLPSAVVVYENQKIVGVVSSTQGESKFWSITAETDNSVDTVKSFVTERYTSGGWKTESTSTFDSTSSYSFSKDDLQALITISQNDDNKVGITYYITQETPTQ
jgi:hypothetical protein